MEYYERIRKTIELIKKRQYSEDRLFDLWNFAIIQTKHDEEYISYVKDIDKDVEMLGMGALDVLKAAEGACFKTTDKYYEWNKVNKLHSFNNIEDSLHFSYNRIAEVIIEELKMGNKEIDCSEFFKGGHVIDISIFDIE